MVLAPIESEVAMNHNQEYPERESGLPAHPQGVAIAAGVATGSATGALVGLFTFAGPLAVVIGMVIGAVAGLGIAEYVRERSKRDRVNDERLDRETGVSGAAPPTRP
jgi:hypothetical protein